MITRRLLAGLTLGVVAVTTACGSSDSDGASGSEGGEGGTGEVVGTVDRGTTKEVTQAGDTLKVVALGWSDGEIALDLGVAPTAIYDWQSHGEDNKGVGPWATEKFGDAEVDVIENTGTTYNYEQIELLEPDLILNVRAAGDEKVLNRLAEIAPVAASPEGTADFAINWRDQVEIIGKAIGKDEEATTKIDETTQSIEQAASDHPEFKDKTFVWGSKFGDAYGANLEGDARFDVFAEMGFVANPPLAKLAPSGFYAPVSVEQVDAMDADVAILTTIGLPLKDLESDRLITSLDVVKEDRALLLDEKDESVVALSAGTPQSISLAVEKVVPELAERAES